MRRTSMILVFVFALSACGRVPVALDDSPSATPTISQVASYEETRLFPDRFVAQMIDGRIVVARTADGSVERVLATRKGDIGLVVPHHGEAAYVGPWDEGACFSVERIPLDGGPITTVLDEADRWDVSSDGGSIMFASDGECGHTRYGFVIRDLDSGSERHLSFALKDRHDLIEVDGVRFLENARYVYVTQCGADSCGPILVDLQKDHSIGDSSIPCETEGCTDAIPGDENPDWYLSGIVNRGARGTVVSGVDYASVVMGTATSPVLELDPVTLKIKRVLYRRGRSEEGPPNPEPLIKAGIIDYDASGAHALMLGDEPGGRLYRWDGARQPVFIGAGFARAAW